MKTYLIIIKINQPEGYPHPMDDNSLIAGIEAAVELESERVCSYVYCDQLSDEN